LNQCAASASLLGQLASGGFADLRSFNLSCCHLSFDQLRSLLQLLAAGSSGGSNPGSSGSSSSMATAAAALRTLEVGANPGVQQDDFEG
jgi:hypothetical protein